MWLNPRATIRYVVSENPNQSLWILAAIYGFSSLLNSFQSAALGGHVATWLLLALAIILAPLWGYAVFSVWGWLVLITGKILKGEGTFKAVRAAYAWSCVPLAVNAFCWFVLIAMMGGQIFQSYVDGHLLTQTQITLLFILLIAKMVFVIWAIVLYLNALAEVQRFSVLRAIGNVIMAGVIGILAIFILYSLGTGLTHIKGVTS
jgi:hypothetical protein